MPPAGAGPRGPRPGDTQGAAAHTLDPDPPLFLAGCGLPGAWAGQERWRILQTHFGLGHAFLASWQAWRSDPRRPRMLHYVAVDAAPMPAEALLRGAAPWAALEPLAQALAARWRGLLPGTHRLAFEDGRLLLTLHVGEPLRVLREERCVADSIFLDMPGHGHAASGPDAAPPEAPAPAAPQGPQAQAGDLARAAARHARDGTRLATTSADPACRKALAESGFVLQAPPVADGGTANLQGRFAPAWRVAAAAPGAQPGEALVIGAGLAGAAVAGALARRGWRVRVLDAAPQPASGASSLPVGLFTPHQSPDDGPLSRLTRCGLRMTWEALQALPRGRDWDDTGLLERDGRLPREGPARAWEDWCRPALPQERAAAGLPEGSPATWHAIAGWARPGALVAHWLSRPGVQFQGSQQVAALRREGSTWQVLDAQGRLLAGAGLVVVAAALESGRLLAGLPLQPVRGQVSWGPRAALPPGAQLPPGPVNGNGHLVPRAPSPEGEAWYCGATFGRAERSLDVRPGDHAANLQRLQALLPQAAATLAPQFEAGAVRAWTGVRCASRDRRPLVGEVQPGLWTSCAMGSRGLSFALLCAELMAARLHAEPLPLPARLAAALELGRLSPAPAGT